MGGKWLLNLFPNGIRLKMCIRDRVTVSSLEQEARMPSEESFRKAVWKEKVDIYVAA